MKNKIVRPHLIIPESGIVKIVNTPKARTKPVPRNFTDHGERLVSGLDAVKQSNKIYPSSLGDSFVFRIKLHEGHKFQEQTKQEFFKSHNFDVKVVQTNELAVIASASKSIEHFNNMLVDYRKTGKNKTNLSYIEEISPYDGYDKNSTTLQDLISNTSQKDNDKLIDVQLMLLPNCTKDQYTQALPKIRKHIEKIGGKLKREPFFLSDGTPVVRAELTAYQLSSIENDNAIYRAEETNFFHFDTSEVKSDPLPTFVLDPETDLNSLVPVVVIDSGVDFSNTPIDQLILEHWPPTRYQTRDTSHGTQVASRVIFGDNIHQQIRLGTLTPQASVIDACILVENDSLSEDQLIQYIKDIVETYHERAKIYNLSLNAKNPIQSDRISLIAYEIDNLSSKYGVIFVVSAGNHDIWKYHNSISDVLDDDDVKISPPAESYLALTVGAINDENDPNSLTRKDEISPYSRTGQGFAGNEKPDLVAYGGNISQQNHSIFGTKVISNNGMCKSVSGTSFSAPVVSGHLSTLLSVLPEQNSVMIAKTLLIHLAHPIYDYECLQEDEIASYKKLYGNGMPSIERTINSTPSRVTFVASDQLNRLTKHRVTFRVPEILASNTKRKSPAIITITSTTFPTLDHTKGEEYLGAYVSASLHKRKNNDETFTANPAKIQTGRKKWQPICHFKKSFCQFNSGDWEVWLELFTRWDTNKTEDIPYVLAITIETPLTEIDIYEAIQQEVPNKYQPLTNLPIKQTIQIQ
ncbi:MAG: S8 family peptidase [Planctomycetaceae bacterium]|jgi:subtilisin family serine protease|nr:S8 family peptidase [Planctomycetaceae bacterium]